MIILQGCANNSQRAWPSGALCTQHAAEIHPRHERVFLEVVSGWRAVLSHAVEQHLRVRGIEVFSVVPTATPYLGEFSFRRQANYSSAHEHEVALKKEIQRPQTTGFVNVCLGWSAVLERFGQVVVQRWEPPPRSEKTGFSHSS